MALEFNSIRNGGKMNSLQTLNTVNATTPLAQPQLSTVEAELEQVSKLLNEAANLNYPLLNGLLKGIIAAGGKRLRPTLALLAARVPGKIDDIEALKLFQVAAAVEMLHTATLVHDDTIDEALMRRLFKFGDSLLDMMVQGGAVDFGSASRMARSTDEYADGISDLDELERQQTDQEPHGTRI